MTPPLRRSTRLTAAIGSSSNPTAAAASIPRPSKLRKKKNTVSEFDHDQSCTSSRCHDQPTSLDVANNSHPLLLQLPTELLLAIIQYLNPREAIALSFTCHDLYDGLLSDKNHFLWHRIGRFEHQLPGYSKELDSYIQRRAEFERSKTVGGYTAIESVCGELTDSGQSSPSTWDQEVMTRHQVHGAIRTYDPEFYVDYKGILLSTMRGQAGGRGCCQWCFQSPEPRPWNSSVHWRPTTWDKKNLKWTSGTKTIYTWICCEQCQKENSISPDKAEKLGIDLEGVGIHVRIYNRSYYWKPTIQRRVVKRYGEGATISFAHEQWKKGLLNLPAYRERHFTAIFASIKALYSTKAQKDTQLWLLKKNLKIKPGHLQKDWFFASSAEGETDEAKDKWTTYCNHDPLMRLLRHPEIGDLWKDHEWVKTQAERKIEFMLDLLTPWCAPRLQYAADIPAKKLIRDITNIALEVQLETLQAAGLEDLRQRITEANGHGFECPWTLSDGPCTKLTFSSTKEFLAHLVTHCWGVLVRGDMNWLVGTPSIWWPGEIPVQDKTVSRHPRKRGSSLKSVDSSTGTATGLDSKHAYICTHVSLKEYKPHLAQQGWLQKWWPDRWKPSYKTKLKRWYQEWEFFDLCGMTKKDRHVVDTEDDDDSSDESYKPGRA